MAVTNAQLAVALRLVSADAEYVNLPAGQQAILTRLLATATAEIRQYLGGTDEAVSAVPEDIRDEATIRVCGFLYDSEPAGGRAQFPFRQSGAEGLMARFRSQRLFGPTVLS